MWRHELWLLVVVVCVCVLLLPLLLSPRMEVSRIPFCVAWLLGRLSACVCCPEPSVNHGGCAQTPLHLAARHYADEFLPVVGMLVECGANVGAVDRDGFTPPQLATNERIMFVLGQHITRISNLHFTSYERAMYRRRSAMKWSPSVSFSKLLPALAGWFVAVRMKNAVEEAVLTAEGARSKAAAARVLQLALSPNRYVNQPRGGAPGSPVRLRAAAAVLQSDDPNAIARRREKRKLAVQFLMDSNAMDPTGACVST